MEPLTFTREQMERRVARFADLKPVGDIAGNVAKIAAARAEALAQFRFGDKLAKAMRYCFN